MALLEVAGLKRHFGGVHAVDDATFEVEEGAISALIGPNGAGKSTTIELISGFLRPDEGVVRFAGREIQGFGPDRVVKAGMIRTFQSSREWASLTVMENLLMAAEARKRDSLWRALFTPRVLRRAEAADRVRAREVLEEFGLMILRDAPARTLSGGQKRLLEFARIIMARPRMVLLDEPLAGVNPVLIKRIASAISGLSADGITVLLIEHNLNFVEAVCGDVIVMSLGRVIAKSSMAELRRNPAVVEAYLGEVATNV